MTTHQLIIFFVYSQVKDLNDPTNSVEDMPSTAKSLTSGRVSIRRDTTSKRTRGKKGKRTLLSRTYVQALVSASMEGISSEIIGALAKSIGKRKLVISASEEEEVSSSSEHSESVSVPSSWGWRKTGKAKRAHKHLAARDSKEEDDDEVPGGEMALSIYEARVIVQSCIKD